MLSALLLPQAYQTGWRPLVARSGPRPQRSRAAAAYFSAGIAERTLPARTITVELATDDTSEDGATDRAPRTGAPVTEEVIVDHPSEGSAADDETAALEQPGRPLLTREQVSKVSKYATPLCRVWGPGMVVLWSCQKVVGCVTVSACFTYLLTPKLRTKPVQFCPCGCAAYNP